MQSRIRLVLLGLVFAFAIGLGLPPKAAADIDVDIGFFYDRLAPYGHWFRHRHYGYVWYPIGVEFRWRPYSHGRWVWTPDFGWYWDSYYPWGWAPFHYGRWVFDDDYGWVWVPGYVWGPAWVLWRRGPGFIGWAPMPPIVVWRIGIGLSFDGFDDDADWFAPSWIFVEDRFFLSPRLHEVVLSPARNVTILRRTTDATNYVTVKDRIVNRSLKVDQVEKVTRTKVPRVKIRDVERPGLTLKERESDTEVPVFRPKVKPRADVAPVAPTDSDRRRATGEAILEDEQGAETEWLNRLHKLEREQGGQNLEQLKKQQDAESRALQRQQQRQKEQLRNRQKQWPYYYPDINQGE